MVAKHARNATGRVFGLKMTRYAIPLCNHSQHAIENGIVVQRSLAQNTINYFIKNNTDHTIDASTTCVPIVAMWDWGLLALKGMVIGIAVAAPVGAVGIIVIRRALAERPWAGFIAGLGGALGDAILASAAGFGLTAFTQFLETWQRPLRIGGGIAIIVMGLALFAHMRTSGRMNLSNEAGRSNRNGLMGRRRSFLSALILTLTNPMPLLSFIAIFAAAGLTRGDPSFIDTAIIVGSIFAGSALWFLALSLSAYVLSQRYGAKAARLFDALAASLLIGLGVLALCIPI